MNFDDSFFEGLPINKKEKKKQYPYSVRRQEFRWFLSDNNSADSVRVIEQLKYKADYLYAQNEYAEAMKCYEQLTSLIPPSNTILMQEVCESRVVCLTRLAQTEEAQTCLKEMVKENKMNTSLWHLMFTIERDKKNWEEATFAIQQCVKDNEEVASYWIDLAETYALHSTCFEWPNNFNTCQYQEQRIQPENLEQSLFCKSSKTPVGLATEGSIHVYSCTQLETSSPSTVEGKELPDKQLLQDKHAETDTKEDTLNTRMSNCSIEEPVMTYFEKGLSVESNKLKSYAENHHSCYCSLCSLVISRFLLHKYSTRSQLTKHERTDENILKVNFLINNITCATDEIINETRKLLRVKFANRMKSSYSH